MALEAVLWDHGIKEDWMVGKSRKPTFCDFEDEKIQESEIDMLRNVEV